MKGRTNYVSGDFIISLLLVVAAALAALLPDTVFRRAIAIGVVIVVSAVYFFIRVWRKRRVVRVVAQLFRKSADRIGKYVNAASIPTAIALSGGRILWHNPQFYVLAGAPCEGHNIFHVFPGLSKPDKDRKIVINGKAYLKDPIYAELDGRDYVMHRFVDTDNSYESTELGRLSLPVIAHIQIDNFADLMRGMPQNRHSEVEVEIERVISRTAGGMRAVYQRYERDNYILMFERRYLSSLMQSKFAFLSEVRRIVTGDSAMTPTLSVGVGVAGNPAGANANALKALEMALGRGGDQAVLKDEDGFRYYGGIQQGRETRSKVKSRMFAKALRNLMDQCGRVIIMGHSVPDLDCMGAAMGLLACARRLSKRAHIVIDGPNPSIDALLSAMQRDPDYAGVLISPDDALEMMDAQTMLVIVDTQIADYTITPRLYREAAATVVIDHHVRGSDHIENATLFLYEPYASSTAEMVTEIVQYFSERIALKPLEVEALLAGITIDTKGFSFKTGVRTFEAASYLRRLGADTTKIRSLFQDDLATYKARARVVEQAEAEGGIAISICPDDIKSPQLLAAQAADALVGIRGIAASFVLCRQDGVVMISARSVGTVNVQRILEKMGGGGHASIAGAQVRDAKMEDVVKTLKEKIKEYESEVE